MKNHQHTVHPHVLWTRNALLVVCGLLLTISIGCKRSPEDLEVWRTSKGGTEKLAEWATSTSEPMDVRIRAVEILVEDGHLNRLPIVLDRISEAERKTMLASVVSIVEKMWATQDMPRLSKVKEEGGQMAVGSSEAVQAKDAAYLLHPYVDSEAQVKFEAILDAWVSEEQELRTQLGNTTIGQVLPRTSDKGKLAVISWMEETTQPATVSRALRESLTDEAKTKMAEIVARRAQENHPDLSKELEIAVLETEHEAIIPYLQQAISDPMSDGGLIDGAIATMVKIQDDRAAVFLARMITEKFGLLRWVAANRVIEVRGKAGFLTIALALPLEPESYPRPEEDSFEKDATQICNLFSTEMAKQDVTTVSDVLTRALENNRWPAQVLGLKCAQITRSSDVLDQVAKLRKDRQRIPGWSDDKTIGQLATEVHAALSP